MKRVELIQRRKQKGFTQDTLAERIDCTTMTISNIELGRAGASFRMVKAISDALDYRVDPNGTMQNICEGVQALPFFQVKQIAKFFGVKFDPENLF